MAHQSERTAAVHTRHSRVSEPDPLPFTTDELVHVGREIKNLPPQQLKVLEGIMRLRSAKEIANEVGLRVSTVRRYTALICDRSRVTGGARGLFLKAHDILRRKRMQERDEEIEPPLNPPPASSPSAFSN